MENRVAIDTEEGSPQGGNLSPLLANVYLNEFDQEFLKRGVPCIRYADDIVLLAKSKRASERLLESSTKYLEERLKLTVNREKSRTVSVFAIRNFKFLGFALGRNGKGIYVRVHPKSWKKFKSRLKELSSRKRCQSIKPSLEKIKVYARGWLNYYGIASMKNNESTSNKTTPRFPLFPYTHTYSVIEPSVDVIYVVLHTCNSVIVKPSPRIYLDFLKAWLD